MKKKQCICCKRILPLSDFHNSKSYADGKKRKCKECRCKRRKERYQKIKGGENARLRKDRKENPEKYKRYLKNYVDKDPERYNRLARERRIKYKPEIKARDILQKSLERGKIEKDDFCALCFNSERKLQAHHEDYNKPLDVVWLCDQCHKDLHRIKREAKCQ